MTIGEFEFDDIFHTQHDDNNNNDDNFLVKVYYPAVTYSIFIIFVIFLSIIVMNLLVSISLSIVHYSKTVAIPSLLTSQQNCVSNQYCFPSENIVKML